jgi:beta-glucosidase
LKKRQTRCFWHDKARRSNLKYHWFHINVPNPGAPTIQRWKEVITTISNEANKTRLKILVLYGIDAISWFQLYRRSNFIPTTNRIAATFNTEIARKVLKSQAYETRASSIPLVFSSDLHATNQLGLEYGIIRRRRLFVSEMGAAMVKVWRKWCRL